MIKSKLLALLARVEPEDIWRPIYDADGSLLADGHEDMRDGSPEDLARVDFSGKRVLDLGCNYGYYSFLAKRLGAASVVGVDIDENAVEGCKLLSRLYRFSSMDFLASDFTLLSFGSGFDCTLLINFIGKKSLCKGIVQILETVRFYSRGNVILSARPVYNIPRSLKVNPEYLTTLYGAEYVREQSFYLAEYLCDFFADQRRMSIISPDYDDQTLKRTFLFTPV